MGLKAVSDLAAAGGIVNSVTGTANQITASPTSGAVVLSFPSTFYAVGSWIPSDQSGATLTFTGVSVNYTRLGNIIHAYGRLTYPTTADGSVASIGGLPLTSANANYALVPNPIAQTVTLAFPLVAVIQTNSSKFNILNDFTGTGVTNLQLSTATILFNIVYPVA